MRSLLRRYRSDLFVALLLLALPLSLFCSVTVGDRTLIPADNLTAFEPWKSAASQFGVSGPPHNQLLSDLVLENYLWKKFIIESLRGGELPLWNPHQFSGVPFLAAGQHSGLYPFSILYYLFPLARAYGLFTVSQFFIAGLFMYLFLRVLGLRRLGAAFGAIAYELCLFMVVSVVFQMIIAGAAWLPLILLFIELMARQAPALGGRPATAPWMVLGAFALGLQILAGHVEITYYTLLVSGAYAAWRLIVLYRRERGNGNAAARRIVLRRGAAMLSLAVFGLALGAIQFVPLSELAAGSFRTGRATYDEIRGWAYPIRHAILYLIPNFYGNPSHHTYLDLFAGQWKAAPLNNATIDWGIKNYVEGGTYLGLLPLLLTPLVGVRWVREVLARRRNSQSPFTIPLPPSFFLTVPFFFVLALFALAFAFGSHFYALIFWLPGINQLHSPFRWVWPLAVSAAVLSAYGIEHLQTTRLQPVPKAHRRPTPAEKPTPLMGRLFCLWAAPSLITFLAGTAVWGGIAVLAALAGAWAGYERIAGPMDRLVAELALASQAFSDGRMFFSYTAYWTALFALLLIASGIVLRVSRCPIHLRGRPVWEYLALGVLSLDLLAAGWGFNPAADPRLLEYVPPSAQFLQADTGPWRFTTFDTTGAKPYNANVGWFFNFEDVRGYDSLFSRQYADYMGLIERQGELDFNRIAPLSNPGSLNSPLLDLLNVKYVISQEAIDNPKYTRVYSAEVQIYRNETVMPRAYVMPQSATLAVDDFAAAVQQFDPRFYVMVDPPDALGIEFALEARAAPVSDIQHSANEVFVTAAVREPSWVILLDTYEQGWKAYIRPAGTGEEREDEARIVRVNGNFRGVTLPSGEWTVRFKYSPVSVRLGGLLSFVSGVGLLFLLGVWAWRYFYQESKIDSTARRIAKNSLAPMALNLLNRAIAMIFAMFYLRVLGPDDVGKYYYAVVIFGWFEIITNYGLNTFLTREVARDREHANRYLINTTVLRLLIGAAIVPAFAAFLAIRQSLPAITLPFGLGTFTPTPIAAETLWAIALLVLAQLPATISTGLSALFYAYEKAEFPAAVATISTLLTVLFGTIALVLGYGIIGLASSSIIVNLVTLGILSILAGRLFFRPRWEVDLALQRHALRESFPLMLNNLLATLFFKVDVTLLEPIRGNREVGWYSAGYKFIDAYNVVPSLFTLSLFPLLSRQAADPHNRRAFGFTYAFAVKLLVTLALPLAVVTTFLAPNLIWLLGGAQFLPDGAIALAILAWSIPFGWINSITNYALISVDQKRGLTRAFAISVIFNVVANLLLLPTYGFRAAAALTIASEIFEGLAFYYYVRKSIGPMPWVRILWRPWASALLMAVVMFGLWPVQPILALLAGGLVYATLIALLRVFRADERTTLLGILPSQLRQRLDASP